MSPSLSTKATHLVFVGFEVQRIVQPLAKLDAKRVYLFTGEADDAAATYWKKIHSILKDYPNTEVKDKFVAPWSLAAILRAYKAVIEYERMRGSKVMINVSTGSKIAVMAGMLASMLWGARPYYAVVNYYARDSKSPEAIGEIVEIPILKVQAPSDAELRVIEALSPAAAGLPKDALIRSLIANGALAPELDPRSTTAYMRLKRLLDPMVSTGLVTVMGERKRSRVMLSSEGREIFMVLLSPLKQPPALKLGSGREGKFLSLQNQFVGELDDETSAAIRK